MKRPINERAQPLNEQQINEAGRYLFDILDTFKRTGRKATEATRPPKKRSNERTAL